MPINTQGLKETLRVGILDALNEPFDENSNPEKIKQDLAENIATAVANGVDAWIKTATVTVMPGIVVTTTPTGAGITTSSGTGTIS